jgi:hypothetical protein
MNIRCRLVVPSAYGPTTATSSRHKATGAQIRRWQRQSEPGLVLNGPNAILRDLCASDNELCSVDATSAPTLARPIPFVNLTPRS